MTEETAADRQLAELDRTFAAFDDGRIVGCAAVFSQQMVVPGGGTVPTAGVTMVGVLPTHRRRGILRELMDRMLNQAVERGEPVATLFASQAAIYGRFGYASSAGHLAFDIALDRISWAVDPPAGRVRLVPREEALPIMQAIYDRAIRQRAGGIVQDADVFPISFREPAKREEKPFYAIRENADGKPDAFAIYRNKHRWPRGLPSVVLKVQRLVATSPDGSQAIWRFLFDVDLVSRVTAYGRPLDDPLLLQVQEPRALRPELDDGLFLRTLDLPAAWQARRYAADGTVTLAVADPVRPDERRHVRAPRGRRRRDLPAYRRDPGCVVHDPRVGGHVPRRHDVGGHGGGRSRGGARAGRARAVGRDVSDPACALADRVFLIRSAAHALPDEHQTERGEAPPRGARGSGGARCRRAGVARRCRGRRTAGRSSTRPARSAAR